MEPRSNERGNMMPWAYAQIRVDPLQWSHAQTNVETFVSLGSMEGESQGFNGATLKRTWKPFRVSSAATRSPEASMEPRSNERGNWGNRAA